MRHRTGRVRVTAHKMARRSPFGRSEAGTAPECHLWSTYRLSSETSSAPSKTASMAARNSALFMVWSGPTRAPETWKPDVAVAARPRDLYRLQGQLLHVAHLAKWNPNPAIVTEARWHARKNIDQIPVASGEAPAEPDESIATRYAQDLPTVHRRAGKHDFQEKHFCTSKPALKTNGGWRQGLLQHGFVRRRGS